MKLPYSEGTWFAVPLQDKSLGAGVVARSSPRGKIVLAYFFGPKRHALPCLADVVMLMPEDAVYVGRVGDLGLINGSWPIIGRPSKWDRSIWSVPQFIRRDDLGRKAWKVYYSDQDPNLVVREERVSYDNKEFDEDAVLGSVAAEVVLSRLLS